MGLKHLEDVTYFRLNNEINRPVNGQIMLHKDKEALDAFFKENVVPNTMVFDSIKDKINYLIEHNYIETAFIKKYRPEFLEELHQFIKEQNFQFKSFMAAYKFYNQYALKTNDGEYYLESMEDRVFFNALYFADGNEEIAKDTISKLSSTDPKLSEYFKYFITTDKFGNINMTYSGDSKGYTDALFKANTANLLKKFTISEINIPILGTNSSVGISGISSVFMEMDFLNNLQNENAGRAFVHTAATTATATTKNSNPFVSEPTSSSPPPAASSPT